MTATATPAIDADAAMMRCSPVAIAVVAAASFVVSCCRPSAPLAWRLEVERLTSPAGPASAQPQLTASTGGVLLSWLENTDTTTTFRFAERTAHGWTEPQTVASGPDFFVNFADVPSVLRLSDQTLVAHWLQRHGVDQSSYDVRLARSRDGGKTWSRAFSPHHDGTKREHGFASLFDLHSGAFGLVWLDGRNMMPSADGEGVGDMSLRGATFTSSDVQGSDVALDVRVCECCPTAAAPTSDAVVVLYRDRSDAEIRNIHATRFAGGAWTKPAPVHDDGWRIDGCPVNGPSVSAAGRRVAAAWFAVQDQRGNAFVAFSDDDGATFGAPIRIDTAGSLGRVDVELLDDGSAVAGWIELASSNASYQVRRIEASGARSEAIKVTDMTGNRNSGYPRMARHGGELVFAWTDAVDSLRVQTARARIP